VNKSSLFLLTFLGVLDSAYLTWDHFSPSNAYCGVGFFSTCNRVLSSSYSEIVGVPLALIGLIHYISLFLFLFLSVRSRKRVWRYLVIWESFVGFVASLYFVFLMIFVIHAGCLYCFGSAVISFLIFVIVQRLFREDRKRIFVIVTGVLYRKAVKPFLFSISADKVHELVVNLGSIIGKTGYVKRVCLYFYGFNDRALEQRIAGIDFKNPTGLAAGFDYDGKLPLFLPSLGFGFGTVGTVTNMEYEGNPPPRLGRLPKSRSLLVNKGFKSSGASAVIDRLEGKEFVYPVGISIGRSNSTKLKTQKESVFDIVSTFEAFEKSEVGHSYYELNVSCPNLIHSGSVEFYTPKKLEALLIAIDNLKLKKPVFVKMPIGKTDREVLLMLEVISKHSPVGVIIGNLQEDRSNMAFDKREIKAAGKGNFSGKPTFKRSNELIELTYRHFGDKLVIVGCGGIFSGEDAYKKIKLGASLVQFITALVFDGPQTAARVNIALLDLLRKDGFKNISEAVGVDVAGDGKL